MQEPASAPSVAGAAPPAASGLWSTGFDRVPARVFGLVWALAHFGHVLRKEAPDSPVSWLWVLAIVALALRPASLARLAALCAVQLVAFARALPFTDNHMYILAFMNAGLLVTLAPRLLRGKGAWDDRAWDARSFGAARAWVAAVFVVSYGAAALSKLNRDFLFSDASCGLTMLDDAAEILGLEGATLAGPLYGAVPALVTVVELAVPLLVAFAATRAAGVMLAVAFHLAISLSPTATALDFTIIIFAVLAVLLPAAGRWEAATDRFSLGALLGRLRVDGPTFGALALFGTLVVFRWKLGTVAGNRGWAVLAVVALVSGAGLAWAALRPGGQRGVRVWPSVRALSPVHAALLALLLVNVAAPYLGVKTVGTFTMYSNLDTYDGASNHYLFPRAAWDAPHDDLVAVLESSNGYLARQAERGRRVTFHELRRRLSNDPDASVRYVRDGVLHDVARAADRPDLGPPGLVSRRLIAHRSQAPPSGECLW